jgi:hypothetical protein
VRESGPSSRPAWRPRNKIGLAAVAALLVALTPLAIHYELQALRPCLAPASALFDREVWSSRFPCNGRRAMADDLENSYLKPGMTRQEVVALLGEPDSYEGGYASDRTIAYEMGCFVDCEWLVVEFDATWQLKDAFAYQD